MIALLGQSVATFSPEAAFVLVVLLIASTFVSFFAKGQFASSHAYNLIGTVASGVGTRTSFLSFKSIPQFLVFEVATTPQNIKINVNGRIEIVNLDTAGINALCNARVVGRSANSFILPLANGLITDLTMDVEVINNVASAFDIFGVSKNAAPVDGAGLYTSLSQTLQQGTANEFRDFKYLALPNLNLTNDVLNIIGSKIRSNGVKVSGQWNGRIEPAPMRAFLSQYETQSVASKLALDNYSGEWESVWLTPFAQQKVYVQKLVSANTKGGTDIVS